MGFEVTDERFGFEHRRPSEAVQDNQRWALSAAALVDGQVLVAVRNSCGEPRRRGALAKLNQHPVGLFRMEEENELAVGAGAGFVGERSEAALAQALHVGVDVVHLKSEVMQPLASFFQKPRYGRVGAEGFEEFELGVAGGEEVRLYAFVVDAFVLVGADVQQSLVEPGCGVRVFNGDTDVFEVGHEGGGLL